jgi:hypothetical protein
LIFVGEENGEDHRCALYFDVFDRSDVHSLGELPGYRANPWPAEPWGEPVVVDDVLEYVCGAATIETRLNVCMVTASCSTTRLLKQTSNADDIAYLISSVKENDSLVLVAYMPAAIYETQTRSKLTKNSSGFLHKSIHCS